MATLFYSVAGEGRGHAIRARSMVDGLSGRHKIVLFASGVAYDLLSRHYRGTGVAVRRIPGLMFHYSGSRIDYLQTACLSLRFLRRMERLVHRLVDQMERDQPDLAISDFEPTLSRAAHRCGLPVVSFDHQHLLTTSDLSLLPWSLRLRANLSAPVIDWYCEAPVETIVSSFHFPPPSSGTRGPVLRVGPLLRKDLLDRSPSLGGHLLVYLHPSTPAPVREALRRIDREVRVYALPSVDGDTRLNYRPISDAGFLEDLLTCDAVICNAGNQLLGEALYLGKPVFALPIPRQFEQQINAHLLRSSGYGEFCEVDEVRPDSFLQFLERSSDFRHDGVRPELCGTRAALAAIERRLAGEKAVSSASQRLDPAA